MNFSEHAFESAKVFRWLRDLEENPLQYYQVELSDNSSGAHAPLMLSDSYVASKDLDPSIKMFELAEQKLILNMLIDGVIHEGETAAGCNWRLKLLGWYKSLSQEEKLALPIFGNKLKLSKSVVPASALEAIKYGYSRHESVRLAYQEINLDLQSLGVASADYMTVKERVESKEEFVPQENALVDFKRLQMLDFAALDGLEKSSEGRPFNDLKHAFATASLGTTSDSGASNYHEGFKWFTKLLAGQGFNGTEPLTEVLDPFSLPSFRSYLERHIVEGTLSPITATTLVSAVRTTLTTIKNIKGYAGSDFINCQGFDPDRVTDSYRPYSSAERVRISTSVNEDIEHYNTLAKPYQRSGIGEDPIDAKGSLRPGCNTLENARWIFENKLGCAHVGHDQKDSEDPHVRAFLRIVSRSGIGLREIVEGWGVHYLVDAQVITPYAIKLAQVTGLNADSIKLLDVDDYEPKHPLTGRPCLRYWKERSDGEKLMHLDIFEADITWLTTSQSYAVAQIFEDIKALTASFRDSAPPVMRDKLFIWQSSAPKSFMEIKSFATGKENALWVAFAAYAKRKGLLDSAGQQLSLTPSRLRPSFISELVERNVPIREIQLILGHKHIDTTLAYLDRMDFNHIARSKLDVALRELHESAAEVADNLSSREAEANLIDVVNLDGPQVVFKTPLASCRNIFNPPEFIKKLSSYVPGSPCALYNMCLGCENVLLTASNLPELFAMERDYLTLKESSRIMDTPYGRVVRENLALLDGILHSKSDFTSDELDEGRRLSEFVDTTVLVDGGGDVMMEQINFSTLLTFSRFRSSLSLLQGQAWVLDAESEQQEALAFLAYLNTLKVSQRSAFLAGVWDFNADYPNASRHIRGAKLRIDFTKYPNIPELAILELKAAFMIILKALSGIPAGGKPTRVSKKPLKPNTLISDYESGLRFLDKVYSVAAIELGKEHVDRELISIQCLPAHFYAAAAEDFDYVYDEHTEKLFKLLKSGYLQANVFGASLPFVDFSKLKWKVLGGTKRPEKDVEKKSQILPNNVFEISSQMASLSIVDFLDAMGEDVVDAASLKRRNAKEYFPSQQVGLNPLKFNLYVYKRLANKGFSKDEVAKVLGGDVMNSSRFFSVIAPYAVKQYEKDTGSALDDQFRLYLNFVNYSCLYIIGQYTGMRPSEYAELLASSSLRPDGRYWVLASNVSKHQDNLVELFDDFWLAIPIVRDAVRVCQLISKYKNNDYIFSNVDTVAFGEKGQPFSSGATKHMLDSFFERILPPETFDDLDFNAYMMRHTLAYQLYRADLGLPFISHQLKHFGEIVGVGHSDRGFSKTTLLYGEIADRISKGGGARKAKGRSLRQDAELESIHQRFDPDGSYAGVNAEAHKENLRKVFRGYMASGHTKDDIFEAMLGQHIAVINVGSGFCYGGGVDEFDSSLPCIGGLRCNPNQCKNAVVSKANAPAWRDVYYQNKAMLGNPEYAHTHAQNKAAMEEAYGVLQLLEEEL